MADCHSDGISIDVGDAVSQTVTALRFATIVPGAYCCHHADDNELLDLCRKERRVELALESERFFDLVRWGEAAEVLNKFYAEEAADCTIYTNASFTKNKNEYLPIPFAQMSASNGNYTQNCGNW